jgi:hypothetical protein
VLFVFALSIIGGLGPAARGDDEERGEGREAEDAKAGEGGHIAYICTP